MSADCTQHSIWIECFIGGCMLLYHKQTTYTITSMSVTDWVMLCLLPVMQVKLLSGAKDR